MRLLRIVLLGFVVGVALQVSVLLVARRQPEQQTFLASSDDRVYRVTLDGLHASRQSQVYRPSQMYALSPDGQYIAFSKSREAGGYMMRYYHLCSRQVASGHIDCVAPGTFYQVVFVDWSPDSEWILYHAWDIHGIHLYRARPDGTDNQLLVDHLVRVLAWSPDSQWVFLYPVNDGQGGQGGLTIIEPGLWQVHIATGQVALRTEQVISLFSSRYPFWSVDGQWLYYFIQGEIHSQLFRISLNGAVGEPLPGRWITAAAQSSDGAWLYIELHDDPAQHRLWRLYRARPDGSGLHPLVEGSRDDCFNHGVVASQLQPSPDGLWLAFSINCNAGSLLAYSIDLETDAVRRLAFSTRLLPLNGWTPDSQWILFWASTGLHRVRPDGTDMHNYSIQPGVSRFHAWLPPLDRDWSPATLLAAVVVMGAAGTVLMLRRQ